MKNIVKLMKEQGNQFDWSQIVIDLSDLPCFKPEAEWPSEPSGLGDLLVDGYTIVSAGNRPTNNFIVRVTGGNPSVSIVNDSPVFVDCEPVMAGELIKPLEAVPAVVIGDRGQDGLSYGSAFGLAGNNVAAVYPFSVSGSDFFVGYQSWES